MERRNKVKEVGFKRSLIKGVLFDLDGTLLDTAPDLTYALNVLRKSLHLPEIPLTALRPYISLGSKEMVKQMLGIPESAPDFNKWRENFLEIYSQNIANLTQLFPHVEAVLAHLDQQEIPWGIVTNKLTRHTSELLKALHLDHRPICVICGDSLKVYKPDPAPILHGCELLKCEPKDCLYVGDAFTDVAASKAAGTTSLVALYGYIGTDENPFDWQADGYLQDASELFNWLPGKEA